MENINRTEGTRVKRHAGHFLAVLILVSLVQGRFNSDGIPRSDDAGGSGRQVTSEMQVTAQAENPLISVGPTGELSSLIELLFEKNREIRAAAETYLASVERAKTFGVLPDPNFEFSLFLEPVETRNGPMEGQFMLGQKFPLWGKLRREKLSAEERAGIAALNLYQKKVLAVFQMRKAWEGYLKTRNSLDILSNYREELESFRSIALTQYSTGAGLTQHPILNLQIEIALIESQINSLQSSLESAVNDLQSLFDGSFSPELFSDHRTSVLPSNPADRWLSQAREVHPLYQIAQHEHRIAVLENELAARQNYPDLVAGLTYTAIGDGNNAMAPSPGADAVGFKLGLNIPLWLGRNKARVQSTKSMIRSREENIEGVWNRIKGDVQSTQKDLDEIEETYTLYEEQTPSESDQMLSSAFAAYETGKIDFLDLLDSERMVVRVRLEFEAVEAQRRIASAQLLRDIGTIYWDEE